MQTKSGETHPILDDGLRELGRNVEWACGYIKKLEAENREYFTKIASLEVELAELKALLKKKNKR